MLTLRREHYQAFQETAKTEFVRRMRVHLRKEFPQKTATMPGPDLDGFITRHRTRAEAYNISLADDVEYYLDCAMRYGEHFDTDPKKNWAGQILRTPSLKGSEKVTYLKKFAAEREKNG